jgi:hypothetical protein
LEVSVTSRTLSSCQALCAILFLIPACGADSGSSGELENGSFSYLCTTDRDPICGPDATFIEGTLQTMPNTIAVGGQFSVVFRGSSSSGQDGSAFVKPVSSDLLAGGAGNEPIFTAAKPGFAGLLALRGSTVVDVIHVHIVAIDSARIDARVDTTGAVIVGAPTVNIGTGALVDLSAAAADEGSDTLAGSLDYAWSTDDSAIAEILTSPTTDEITVRGGAPGQTMVHVTISGVSSAISIVVADAPGGSP